MKTHLPLVFVIILFPLSTLLVVLSLGSLPVTVSWPRTLEDLASMGKDLHSYSKSGTWPLAHVVGVLSISAVWKHAWSVPGSVAWVSGFRTFQGSSKLLNAVSFLVFVERSRRCPLPPRLGHSAPYIPHNDWLYFLLSPLTTDGTYLVSVVSPCSYGHQECFAWRFRFQLDFTK